MYIKTRKKITDRLNSQKYTCARSVTNETAVTTAILSLPVIKQESGKLKLQIGKDKRYYCLKVL